MQLTTLALIAALAAPTEAAQLAQTGEMVIMDAAKIDNVPQALVGILENFAAAGYRLPYNYATVGNMRRCRVYLVLDTLSGEITCPVSQGVYAHFTVLGRKAPAANPLPGGKVSHFIPLNRVTNGGTFTFIYGGDEIIAAIKLQILRASKA